MKWISVKDELPNGEEFVLVSCEHGVTMAEYTTFKNGNDMWFAVTRIGSYEDSQNAEKVTHWMPLPKPPIHY